MIFNKFKKEWLSLSKENLILKVSVLVLSITLFVSMVLLFKKREKVILVPPVISQKMEITQDGFTKEYEESMAIFFASFLGNITKHNANYVIETAKKYFTTSSYGYFRDQFAEIKLIIERNDYNYVFYPKKVIYDPKSEHFAVEGTRIVYNGDKKLSEEEIYYEIGFIYENWDLRINYLEIVNNKQYR